MENNYLKRNIIAIDWKSFIASCECIKRNLDPFETPLVVCDPTKEGAITLAVTPYLKKLGVPGRTRAYLLPKNIPIIKVPPRMSLYIQKSKEVISVYLEFVSREDMHIYSIDEVFLDVTDYLSLYKTDVYNLANIILNRIKDKTGLTGTAGIGPNILLAKVAMDIEAKHNKFNIAEWTYDDVKTKLWSITPLSKMWGIGPRMEKRLNNMGMYSIKDIANYDKRKMKDKFGILGEEMHNHCNGIDTSRISQFKNNPKEKSISHSQILYKDYSEENIGLIISEMVDFLTRRLRNLNKDCEVIGLGISYSKLFGGGFYHSMKYDKYTQDNKDILAVCLNIFDRYYENLPIRKVSITLANLVDPIGIQLNIFESYEKTIEDKSSFATIDKLKERFGPNSINNASSLLDDSTVIERNKKIGGHNAWSRQYKMGTF